MKKVLTFTTALGAVLLSANANAAGFHLREQSAAAQGNAYAGATAGAEDNSYAYYNVAGLTRQKGTQLTMGGTYIAPKATAKKVRDKDGKRDADVENVVHAAVSPNITISHQINDKWFVGLAGNSPFGMITKYDHEWVGSDHGVTSDVKTATFTPMAAYKATDKLSLGIGAQLQYLWAHLTSSSSSTGTAHVAEDGHSWAAGYQLGALYELNDSTRFGIGYRSEIQHKIKGKMKSSGSMLSMAPDPKMAAQGAFIDSLLNQRIKVDLDTPAMLSFGAYHDINDRWAIMAEYQRVFWSSFQDLTFKSRSGNNKPGYNYIATVKENWRDTNFYSIGTSIKLDEQWKLRLGFAYDQSAVRYQHRTPRIPDTDRFWTTVGLGYQYNEHLSFNMAYTYINARKASLDTGLTGNDDGRHVHAEYHNSIQAFAFGLSYNF
ncbi:MAG: outer membrane protein transport protein [Alphaproteobacteria bacterium]|nr:outer membrane protein transport protein [Alphaproteobacteria bacterium]